LAFQTVEMLLDEAQSVEIDEGKLKSLLKSLAAFGNGGHIASTVGLLPSIGAGIRIPKGTLNRKPMLFNVANGTIDLSTGLRMDHAKSDLITKLSPVSFDAKADCPRW